MLNKKQHKGNWATFDEDQTKKLEDASSKLREILAETNNDNRDTQILGAVLKQLNWVIDQQYEK